MRGAARLLNINPRLNLVAESREPTLLNLKNDYESSSRALLENLLRRITF